jgi:hypothetical protein
MSNKINWYEKPEIVNMTNNEVENVMREQERYFDTFPNAWHTNWHHPDVREATIYNDEGQVFMIAKRQSKNSWRVRTTF